MGPHGRHTGTAADEHHFSFGLLGEELTEWPHNRHLVTGLQVEDVG